MSLRLVRYGKAPELRGLFISGGGFRFGADGRLRLRFPHRAAGRAALRLSDARGRKHAAAHPRRRAGSAGFPGSGIPFRGWDELLLP